MHRTDCKILVMNCVFGCRRSSKTTSQMAEDEYVCEKLDYGGEK